MPSDSEAKMLPRRSARGRNGRTVSEASVALTLTANGTKSPPRASRTISAMVSPALSCASRVLAPRWGVTTTESNSKSGDEVVGSSVKTSSPAPPTMPSRTAQARASSSTMPPRAVSIMRRPRGDVGLGDVPGMGEKKGGGVLGGREDVGLRGIDHHDAAAGGGGHVHVVDTDARPTDHDQLVGGIQHVGCHLGRRADDEGVG